MKIELGKTYKNRSGELVDIVSVKKALSETTEDIFLGVAQNSTSTVWYYKSGRYNYCTIHESDLVAEVKKKVDFTTEILSKEGKITASGMAINLKQFIGQKVKITVEHV